MNLREAALIAARSLRMNKLRSVLTTLGIVIGVAAVILLVGLGNGMKAGFSETFGKMATQITVSKSSGSVMGKSARNLTDSDVEALRRGVTDAASVTPLVSGTTTATYDQQKYSVSITGSTSDYLQVADRELLTGQMFTAQQEKNNARVAVLGVNVVSTLFGGDADEAIDKQIRIGRTTFTVIGVMTSDMQGDDAVVMPLGAARSYLIGGSSDVDQIIVKAASAGQVSAAQTEIQRVLDDQHHVTDPTSRDYGVRAFQNQLNDMSQTMTYMTVFIVAIAAISLVVGGIGVANIMLVSVTERTREIGIRKAIGARRSAIMKQFLIEAIALSGLGGIIGVAIGIGLTLGAAQIIPKIAPRFGAPDISLLSVLVAFLFSLLIGLLAGGYPALRASKLHPIDALRFQ
ncbi:MAG TPA: ABC transporter permease [Pseudonocardia sp.]|nr:ABC transporter permease [Pseudonocardia sp.]